MCSIAALSAGTTIIGTGLSVFGKLSSGRTSQALAEVQAKAIEQQAEADRRASNFEIQRSERTFKSNQGAAIAQVGASGVGLAGSPTDVLAANAGEHQLDIDTIRYGSLLRQSQAKTQADISRFQGAAAMRAAWIGAAGDVVNAASSFFDPTKSIKFGNSPFAQQQVSGLPNWGRPR